MITRSENVETALEVLGDDLDELRAGEVFGSASIVPYRVRSRPIVTGSALPTASAGRLASAESVRDPSSMRTRVAKPGTRTATPSPTRATRRRCTGTR